MRGLGARFERLLTINIYERRNHDEKPWHFLPVGIGLGCLCKQRSWSNEKRGCDQG